MCFMIFIIRRGRKKSFMPVLLSQSISAFARACGAVFFHFIHTNNYLSALPRIMMIYCDSFIDKFVF